MFYAHKSTTQQFALLSFSQIEPGRTSLPSTEIIDLSTVGMHLVRIKGIHKFWKVFLRNLLLVRNSSIGPSLLSLSLAVSVFLKMHPPTSYLDSLPFLEKRFFSKAFLDRPIPNIINVVSHRLIRSRFPFYRLHVERMHAARSAFTLTIDLYYWKVQFAAISYGEREREKEKECDLFSSEIRPDVAEIRSLAFFAFSSRYLIPAVNTLRNVTGGRCKNKITSLTQPSRLNFLFLWTLKLIKLFARNTRREECTIKI